MAKRAKTGEMLARDVGLEVKPPAESCEDQHCPFHGTLRVRGQMINGTVVSDKMDKTVVLEKVRLHWIPKYERFEKRTRRYKAHAPPCLRIQVGDQVTVAECRPLAKTVTLVVVEKVTP